MKLDDRVWELGIKKKLWTPTDRILIACSGGVDSMVLLNIFHLWSLRRGIQIFAIHCDHQLRGEESKKDSQMVEEWCQKANIPLIIEKLPVLEVQDQSGGNLEEICRILRYQAIYKAAEKWKVNQIALAHHAGDQAETVLLHLLRGSGTFRGMEEKRGILIRPLLSFSKAEIIKFAEEENIPYREDSTNLDTHFRRNWVRSELLPLLKKKIQPEIESVLGRWAEITMEEEKFWQSFSKKWCEQFVEFNKSNCYFFLKEFNLLSLSEKRRIIRYILFSLRENLRGFEFFHVESIIELAEKGIGKSQLSLPHKMMGYIFEKKLYIETVKEKEEKIVCESGHC